MNIATRKLKQECPNCLDTLGAVSSIDTIAQAVPGDFTLCAQCGALLKFNDRLDLEICTQDDIESLVPEERQAIENARKLLPMFKR